ncbi:MAG TPA: hypothetical protein PKH97_12705, partial [Tetrasphaera sp.]|uniref:hypothetical protein n=1 Tax=Nostocoides sp. TaxID=1917966 RepID=UPI002C5FBE05
HGNDHLGGGSGSHRDAADAAAPTLSVNAFGPTYRNSPRIVSVVPKGAPVDALPASTWTFRTKRCDVDVCPGYVLSSSGAKYGWVRDGKTLHFTRADEKISVACGSTGRMTARRISSIDAVHASNVAAAGHITGFTMSVAEKLHVDKLENCRLHPGNWTQSTFESHIAE